MHLACPGLFEVPDATLDERFASTECALATRVVRSYAGSPLRTACGDVLGTLSIYGTTARSLSPEQRASLLLLAEQCVSQAEVRAKLAELSVLAEPQPTPTVDVARGTGRVRTTPATPKGSVRAVICVTWKPCSAIPSIRRRSALPMRTAKEEYCAAITSFCTMLGFDPGDLANRRWRSHAQRRCCARVGGTRASVERRGRIRGSGETLHSAKTAASSGSA